MNQSTRRIFFALWPDEGLRRAIVAQRRLLGQASERRVPDGNLHLTLLFLGDQPAGRVDEILSDAGEVRAPPFDLQLDRFGWFAGARVVWLGGEAPAAGADLVRALAGAMDEAEVDYDHRPWRPHVTLFRKVARRPQLPAPAPVGWPVLEFALIESIPGRPYQVLRSWPLESGSD